MLLGMQRMYSVSVGGVSPSVPDLSGPSEATGNLSSNIELPPPHNTGGSVADVDGTNIHQTESTVRRVAFHIKLSY